MFNIRNLLLFNASFFVLIILLFAFILDENGAIRMFIALTAICELIAFSTLINLRIARNVESVKSFAKSLASGDLTTQINDQGQDEFSEINQSLNAAIEKLRRIIRSVDKAAETLDTVSDRSVRNAAKSAEIVDNQSEKVESIATAMEEMSNTIASVAEDIQAVSDQSEQASDNSEESSKALEIMIQNLNELTDAVTESAKTFDQVESRAKDIDHFLEVITDVADQTNLLALNAAIEAARAGEHGRGFAVVADEVRQLAQRTQESATEIGGMTAELSKQIRATAEISNRAEKLAQGASEQANSSTKSIGNALAAIQHIAERMGTVASALEQQRVVSEDIASDIAHLSTNSQRSVDIAEDSKSDIQKVSDLASELNEELNEFNHSRKNTRRELRENTNEPVAATRLPDAANT